jgi:hypothetical protein
MTRTSRRKDWPWSSPPPTVEVLGWRLGTLADKLQENNLAAVRILPKRYAELERNQPYVAFIGITPIAKG